MALIKTIEMVTKERQTLHGETACLASVLTGEDGQRYLQLDTYGSKSRKLLGKVSQSVQFDEKAGAELKRLIEQVFPT